MVSFSLILITMLWGTYRMDMMLRAVKQRVVQNKLYTLQEENGE